MNKEEIKIEKSALCISLLAAILIGFLIFSYPKASLYILNQDADIERLEAKFAILSQATGSMEFV